MYYHYNNNNNYNFFTGIIFYKLFTDSYQNRFHLKRNRGRCCSSQYPIIISRKRRKGRP